MPSEVRNFAVAVAPGSTAAAPVTTNLTMPARIVRGIRIRIPPGPSGLMGWALGSSGVRVIPWNANAWIVADDEVIEWALDSQVTSGAWQVQAYNTGRFTHTVYFTFLLDPVAQRPTIVPLTPLTVTA